MQDAWRSYLELALGFTEASRKRAMNIVKTLTEKSGVTVEQLQQMAQDLSETSAANREALVKLVRYELDRALATVGLATTEEVTELNNRIRDLEARLRDAQARAAAAETQAATASRTAARAAAGASQQPAGARPAAKRTTKKAAKETTAKETTAKKAPGKQAAKPAKTAKAARSTRASRTTTPGAE